jgi:hypothetical protein
MPQIEVYYYKKYLIHTPRYRGMGAFKGHFFGRRGGGKNQEVKNYGSYFNETVT